MNKGEQLKQEIFAKVREYYESVHKPNQDFDFISEKSKINYAGRVFDENEIVSLVDSALDFWLTNGRFEKEFQLKLASFLGAKHVVTANSGSSANLLAISALTSYKLGERRLKPGDEVITVAAGFPTTVAPIVQNGLIPVFVDIDLGTYNINAELLDEAISPSTKAVFLAHTLGVPFDLDRVVKFAKKHKLWLIEDNCDALGAKWDDKFTGTFGDLATYSFYPAHHITMGEGGAITTDDTILKQIVTSFRDWGRDCWCEPGQDNTCNRRFEGQFGSLPVGYDHKYVYSHLGYNLKLTDMQAAIGVSQLDKLPAFIQNRRDNWHSLYQGIKVLEEFFILPNVPLKAEASPFGFVLTVRDDAPFDRRKVTSFLEECRIQTRTIFAGNITHQPAFTDSGVSCRIAGELKNTDIAMTDAFWVGVYPGISERMLEYMIEIFQQIPRRFL